ncbi:predicted protein [Histoplasma mississippiense (nom. inval.)]|uniref:predicted protein n=1 Tax=Ajellomyces capsulatus (strain NAm1 / WU24) TaxID=2059318 RepID=UPI000157C5B5|nr:predicted protein [Histoplasma mississippiense (nom. inval.)]EDN08294.1 predicted protein [Histoplasma mississippiense (nom. inval.)]
MPKAPITLQNGRWHPYFRNGWKSTYICPLTGATALFTTSLQILGLALDTVTLIAFGELGRQCTRRSDGRRVQTAVLWGFVLIGVSAVWLLVAFLIYFFLPQHRHELLSFSSLYLGSVIKLSLIFACAFVSASCLWAAKAKSSQNLQDAVAEYQRRYKHPPPPGFDLWYKYATERSSVVIDDYDQIYEDLLPFRALSPRTLRELTYALAADHSNDVATVSIRGGTTQIQEDILPTHRWMIEGVAKMIGAVSQHLPDMDIAFNLNDECRVAVPWGDITALHNSAKSHIHRSTGNFTGSWSENRASTWGPSEPAKVTHGLFTDTSFQQVYDLVGRSVCPPSSKAGTSFVWDRRKICLDCTSPHSLEQFLSNWTLASDICHQPDLASLSGFYLSPSAFKVSRPLLPVFSQSKNIRI